MAPVTTHKGGPFYNWYESVYGYGPPATVDDQACRYLAWKRGWPKAVAAAIPYGAIGNCGIYAAAAAGTALATPPRLPAPKPAAPSGGVKTAGGALLPAAGPSAAQAAPPEHAPIEAAAADVTTWWRVTASREVLGGIGACRKIEPRGYSELSTNPSARQLDFAALGRLHCLTGLLIRNPANGKVVGAVKQDIGAGSLFLPVVGLYPQTLADIGLDVHSNQFTVDIRRQDGGPLRPVRGTEITLDPTALGESGVSAPVPSRAALYFNPLGHAKVRPERVDQGVDYAGTGYLVAIADGVMGPVVPNGSGWEGEGYLEYTITQRGSLYGAVVYYAEGIDPVVHEGEKVSAGSRLCNLRAYMPHGIEIGFAAGAQQESYYRYHDGPYDGHSSTRPGIAFDNLVRRLGGPHGIVQQSVVGRFPEYMQSGTPGPDIQPGQVPTGSNPIGGGISLSGQFDWPSSLLSAFVQLQRGAQNGSHHAHAGYAYAIGVTYVPKSEP